MNGISNVNPFGSVSNYNNQASNTQSLTNPTVSPSSEQVWGSDSVSGLLLNNSSNLANYIASGYNAHKQGATVAGGIKNLTQDFAGATTSIFKAGMASAGIGAMVVGAAEGWEQAVLLSQGKTTLGRATGGIIGKALQGGAGGLGAAFGGGAANLIGTAMNLASGSTPLAVVTILGGAVGGALAAQYVDTSNIEHKISSAIDG